MQYLLYVHNAIDGSSRCEALAGDAVEPPASSSALASWAHCYVDQLDPDPLGAVTRAVQEAFAWEREHGEEVLHMDATTNLRLVPGPNFERPDQIVAALHRAARGLNLKLARSA